jgi:hypothetical protein
VKLAPGSLVANQQLTRALLALDRVDEARDVIKDAAARGLDSSAMRQFAFDLAFIARDAGAMREHLRAATERPDGYLVVTEAARAASATGDIDGARALYARAISSARATHINDIVGNLIAEQALNDALIGDGGRAHVELQSAIDVSRGAETTWSASLAASFSGRAAQAAELAKGFQAQPPAPDVVNAQVPMLYAAAAIANRDGVAALAVLSSASSFEASAGPWLPYLRGLANALNGDRQQAAREFHNVLAHPANQPTNVVRSLAQLQLARAARDAGDLAEARRAYAEFAAVMRNAGPRHPLLAASARELAALSDPPVTPAR